MILSSPLETLLRNQLTVFIKLLDAILITITITAAFNQTHVKVLEQFLFYLFIIDAINELEDVILFIGIIN